MLVESIPGYLASKIAFNLMCQQAETGFTFDVDKATSLVEHIKSEMKKLEEEVEPQLPPRGLKKTEQQFYTFPQLPFKKDGTISAHGQKFLERHGLTLIGVNHTEWQGKLIKIVGGEQLPDATAKMTLSNQVDLKDYLIEQGWKPTLWNLKKGSNGKPERDERGKPIQTTPKLQEMGKLCVNLEQLNGSLVKQVVKWLSYRNRLSVLENQTNEERGWLNNNRLAIDGRLSGASTGIAATHRQKHTVICNVPKADPSVLLGTEMRSLFKASDGMVLVGYDAAALEARVEAHYCYKYPGGEAYAYDLLEGDIHLKTAEKVFFKQIGHLIGKSDYNKDHPLVKPWRNKSKAIKYSSTYGASPAKVAQTIGIPESQGKEVYDAFWEAAEPLADLKERLTEYWETTGEKKWIKAIDGRKLYSRSKHSLVNLLFQSCGAIAMDYSGIFMDKWLGGIQVDSCGRPGYEYNGYWVYRLEFMHDEYVFECHPDIAPKIAEMGVKSIEQAGKFLKLRVPLTGEAKIGNTWASIH